MTAAGFVHSVPCAGCDNPTPYEVGEAASFGEHLKTPLGLCYRRTHRRRECVLASRAAVEGRPVTLGPPREERGIAAPQSAHPGPASCAATPAVMDAGRLPHPPVAWPRRGEQMTASTAAAAVASAPWWEGPMLALDLETTHPQPEVARIVTAALVFVHGRTPPRSLTWLADPGIEIPEAAAAIHGITTERARADGQPAADVVRELLYALAELPPDVPLVAFNARFDCTVVEREARRHGLSLPPAFARCVICPMTIDRQLDRFRRSYPRGMTPEQAAERGIPSSRTLAGMCQHYGARLDDAHAADADAIAAARLAWCIGARGQVVRRVRGREDAIEKARLVREWEACRHDLARLHAAQQRWALAERVRFAEYKRSIGEHDEAARIEQERGWPVLGVVAREAAA